MTTKRADTLLHPVRIRIAQAVAGRELTTKELAEEIPDVPVSSIYRHVAQLVDAGFLEVTDSRPVRGTVERTYTLNTEQSSLGPEDVADLDVDQRIEHYTAFVGSVLERGSSYLRNSGIDPPTEGFSYHVTPLWVTPEELVDLRARLTQIFQEFAHPDSNPDRRRKLLTTILVPDRQTGDTPK